MKKICLIVVILLCSDFASLAQLGINSSGAAPISSAQLDVVSTTKAFYPPRMSSTDKTNIAGKQAGAVVYDNNLGALSFYNGSAWISTAPTVSGATYIIGQNALGGKVFWIDETGQHGLVASLVDQTNAVWYNGDINTKAIRSGVYGGSYNTERILDGNGDGIFAAQIASSYTGGNYGDWYLPSQIELELLRSSGLGLLSGTYWSSTEFYQNSGVISSTAVAILSSGGSTTTQKNLVNKVRAIRQF